MLGDTPAIPTIAVKDLEKAASFYEDKLGLKQESRDGEELISYRTGSTLLKIYRSAYAGSNQATAAVWVVGDRIDAVVRDLKAKGVAFEHYDMPGMKIEGDLHVGGEMKVAWLKDPDGNILSIASR
jgi:catechol 2,3-dioxygenase-like lactoylglutathione lyase family enzyme